MTEKQPFLLCAIDDIEPCGAKGVVIGKGLVQRRYIVVECGQTIKCYLNQCPHQGTPLDTFPDRFLDETGAFLICSTHGARFDVVDGVCVSGPCVGQSLIECEILIRQGEVHLVQQAIDDNNSRG